MDENNFDSKKSEQKMQTQKNKNKWLHAIVFDHL